MESGGRYPIERRAGEIERLRIQGDAVAFDAAQRRRSRRCARRVAPTSPIRTPCSRT
jgi:hypothetical protein